jgi:hypothetical protein
MTSSPHTLLRRVWVYRPGTFRNKKFIRHSLPSTYVHNRCHLAMLLCWRLTGAPIILVELDRIALRCVRQETQPGSTLKKSRRHYFVPAFVIYTRSSHQGLKAGSVVHFRHGIVSLTSEQGVRQYCSLWQQPPHSRARKVSWDCRWAA